MRRRPRATVVLAAIAAAAVPGACGAGSGTRAGGDPPGTSFPASGEAASAPDLARRLDCETDGVAGWENEDLEYGPPVRSGMMTEAVVCHLPSGESAHVFYRPAEAGPLSDDELSHAFTHRAPSSGPLVSVPPDCSPWLVIGENFVVQLGSDDAADAVRDSLGSAVRSAERTTVTPISLVAPGPCSD